MRQFMMAACFLILPLLSFGQIVTNLSTQGGAFCAGEQITLTAAFSSSGSDKSFKLLLSNKYGNLNAPSYQEVLSLGSQASHTLLLPLPASLSAGSNYRVRLEALDGTSAANTSPRFVVNAKGVLDITVSSTCSGSPLEINLNHACASPTGDSYAVELSNKYGNFSAATTLDTVLLTAGSQTQHVSLPNGLTAGSGYKVKFRALYGSGDTYKSGSFEITAQTIQLSHPDTAYCQGTTLPLTVMLPCDFPTGNDLTVTLSNKYGSFSSGTAIIDTIENFVSGTTTLNLTVPATAVAGTGYRLKVMSSALEVSSTTASFDIGTDQSGQVCVPPCNCSQSKFRRNYGNYTTNSNGDIVTCDGDTVTLIVHATNADTYQWMVNSSPNLNGSSVISQPDDSTLVVAPTGITNFAVKLSRSTGCDTTINVARLAPNPLPKSGFMLSANGTSLGGR